MGVDWISVKDSLPEKDGDVLVYRDFGSGYGKITIYNYLRSLEGFCYWHNDIDGFVPTTGVTHWMPLPEPPQNVAD